MTKPVPSDEFICLLTECQHWLRAYVRSLVPEVDQADDVLQRTNLVLWQKADQFAAGTNFRAWVCQVARFEVLAFRKERQRDHLVFGDQLAELLADEAQGHVGISDDLRNVLQRCLEKLTPRQQGLIAARYGAHGSVQAIAEREGREPDAISAMLYRLRKSLMKCIRAGLKA